MEQFARARLDFGRFGLRFSVVEGYIPHDRIVHGGVGRDEQIEGFVALLLRIQALLLPVKTLVLSGH